MKKRAKEILATNVATLTSIVVLLKLNEMKRKLVKSNVSILLSIQVRKIL